MSRKSYKMLGVLTLATACVVAFAFGCTASVAPQPIPEPGLPLPTATPQPLAFPADHASHVAETEWWYYSGHAESEHGQEFGFHVALFRTQGGDAGFHYDRVQASVIDLADGVRWDWTRDGVSEDEDAAAGVGNVLDISVGDARLRIDRDGSHAISVSDPASGTSMDLVLAPSESVMLHHGIGWIPFPFGSSYYYTLPRMPATGTIRIGDTSDAVTVQGEVWYDHQWGDFIVLGWPAGWYWVGLHLDDGASLMLSEVRAPDGGRYRLFGTHLGADGRQRTLDAEDDGIELEHLEYWRSGETDAEYPISSRISVESLGLDVTLEPSAADQETVTRIGENVAATYWEGSVSVIDSDSGETIGRGYLELAGYVPPDPLSWRDR